VPGLSIVVDNDNGAEPRREHLLALPQLRRNLECLSTEHRTARGLSMALNARDITRELEELIAALDRRVPRVERAGEAAIAREAAALREKAICRLAELAKQTAVRPADGDADA
jgi:hypothetical protein